MAGVYGYEEDDAAEVGLLTLYKGRDIMDYSNVLVVAAIVALTYSMVQENAQALRQLIYEIRQDL